MVNCKSYFTKSWLCHAHALCMIMVLGMERGDGKFRGLRKQKRKGFFRLGRLKDLKKV